MEKGFQINEAELMDFFNGKLSPEEEEKVLAWKESDEANLRIFEEVRIKNLLMCQAVRARLIRGDFGVLRKRLGVSPRRAIRYYWGVAAAVIAIAIMSVIFWPETSSENRLLIASQNAKPAPLTILELADGNQHYLDAGALELTEKDGTQSATSGGKLVYNKPEGEALKFNKITVPRGAGLFQITLGDGSKVWLNSDSRLEYPEKFVQDERRVRISGEAYFEVARDTLRPFVVEAGRQTVSVLGTSFNVSAYPVESVKTTLASGKVKVGLASSQETVVLKPGEQAVLPADGNVLSVNKVDVSTVLAWKEGLISIEDMSFREVLKVVSRAYDVDFVTDSLTAGELVLRGNISADESLEVFLAVLSKLADVEFKMRTDGKIEVLDIK